MPAESKRGRGRPARDQTTVSVRVDDDEAELFRRLHAALEVIHGKMSQGDAFSMAIHAIERELANPPKRRKGPRAVVA